MGVAAAGNIPGGRSGAVTWTDQSGNLWLLGGFGFDSKDTYGVLDDLWKFDPSTNEWAWMNGSETQTACQIPICSENPVSGPMGTPAPGNTPGSRNGAASWTDKSGNLWLFGGSAIGYDGEEILYYSDLWEYFPSSNEWAWIGGPSGCNRGSITICFNNGVYGTLGTPAPANIPGSRIHASSWTDNKGRFWLFGGGGPLGYFNDLWMYDPSTLEWTWMGGSDTFNQQGVYGTLGQSASGNTPGARTSAYNWTDSSGNLWLFGGNTLGPETGPSYITYDFNDLWELNPTTAEWAWMGGSNTTNAPGVYGTLGVSAAANIPSARSSGVSWTGESNRFWLFGGDGPNDLWEFGLSTSQWTWVGGSSMLPSSGFIPGVYGTQGTPAAGNIPGSRGSAMSWTGSNGNLWLFGGGVINGDLNNVYLNDLWEFQPLTPSAATPTFSAAAGAYTSIQTVSISDTTAGASIYYTTDGTTPTSSSILYSSAITVANTETLQAIAVAVSYNNSAVASAAYIINIPPDFSVAATPTALSVSAGSSGTATVSVTPQGGFASAVSFACSGLPSGASCSFLPATVTPSGTAASTTTLTVTTAAASAAIPRNSFPFLPGSALAVAFCCLGWKKRRRLQSLLLLAVGGAGLSLLGACGLSSASGPPPIQPVTSTVTVTATSGSLAHTATFSLVVN
jgi:hypothetical protein